jgi:hypothetical protein
VSCTRADPSRPAALVQMDLSLSFQLGRIEDKYLITVILSSPPIRSPKKGTPSLLLEAYFICTYTCIQYIAISDVVRAGVTVRTIVQYADAGFSTYSVAAYLRTPLDPASLMCDLNVAYTTYLYII